MALDSSRILAELEASVPREFLPWLERARRFDEQGKLEPHLMAQLYFTLPLIAQSTRGTRYKILKYQIDFFLAVSAILAFLPLMTLVGLLIKADSRGPAIYKQLRLGSLGRPFWIYKFRTMELNAEEHNRTVVPLRKDENDRRVTRLGAFLRRYKIDELPQLLNVLKGEMSLIGPRPLSVDESLVAERRSVARFAVRPGMSGLWQALRPSCNDGELKIRLDALYARKLSWRLDLVIFLRTFLVLARGESFGSARRARTAVPAVAESRIVKIAPR